ncbi:CLUMA_CG013445, isoform A [Clunio marinus]|uniref:Cytochrome c oxidase subunit n=1 Tax=Clunio marinus TaxID=568069 RepID=A0A1J1IK85_9DIPT|nr:CLUMA_CG013445, isoform A [Clunio marinus]
MATQIAKRGITTAVKNSYASASAEGAGGHGGGYKLWKRLSFFVAMPAVGLCMLNTYLEHQKMTVHRPEFVKYEYLRIRNKRFPWGDGNKSLFHNPHVNALPDGYEDDDGHH